VYADLPIPAPYTMDNLRGTSFGELVFVLDFRATRSKEDNSVMLPTCIHIVILIFIDPPTPEAAVQASAVSDIHLVLSHAVWPAPACTVSDLCAILMPWSVMTPRPTGATFAAVS
jgi:hypothetical protein